MVSAKIKNAETRKPSKTAEWPGSGASANFPPKSEGPSDEQLLGSVKGGDRQSLGLLFRRYAAAIRAVGLRILRDEGEADDLLQEVFLFLFRNVSIFDPTRGSVRSWIFRIAYHRAFDRRRHLSARRFYDLQALDDDRALESKTENSEECTVQTIMGADLLRRYRQALTAEQTCTLELFFFEGFSLREIAEEMGQTYGNVRNHYYRGLSRLRSLLLPSKSPDSVMVLRPRAWHANHDSASSTASKARN